MNNEHLDYDKGLATLSWCVFAHNSRRAVL